MTLQETFILVSTCIYNFKRLVLACIYLEAYDGAGAHVFRTHIYITSLRRVWFDYS